MVQLGLSVEPVSVLNQLASSDSKEEELAMESAKGIAQDLHNFMGSFAQSTGKFGIKDDILTLPTDCVDRWFKKFQDKHRREPFFWMKKDLSAHRS